MAIATEVTPTESIMLWLLYGTFADCVVLTEMRLWQAKYAPFMRTAQTYFCARLIVVPLTTFHRLSEVIGDPQGELIFLFNTARCGSTLLTQVKISSSDNITILTEKNPQL